LGGGGWRSEGVVLSLGGGGGGVEVGGVEVAVEVLLAAVGDLVDAVAEGADECVVGEEAAAGVDVGAGEADAVVLGDLGGGAGAFLVEVLEDSVVGAGHPVGRESHRPTGWER
jgi:hypothetical protein